MGLMKFDFEMTPTSGIAPAEAASRTDTHLVGMNGPLKRAFDIILTAPIILFLLPALLMIAVAVKRGGGPVLYRQKRIGKDGKAFQMLKFRSMHVDADERLAQLIETCPDSAEEWACYQKLRNDPWMSADYGWDQVSGGAKTNHAVSKRRVWPAYKRL